MTVPTKYLVLLKEETTFFGAHNAVVSYYIFTFFLKLEAATRTSKKAKTSKS